MGMSTHIIGFKPPDERWEQMKKIYDACQEAEVPLPNDVEEFFGWEAPDERGVEVELNVHEWSNDHCNGLELNVEDIPADVKTIRFFNSW